MSTHPVVAIALLSLLVACDSSERASTQVGSTASGTEAFTHGSPPLVRWYQEESVALGGAVYAQYCAECHGAQAQGAADWRKPGPDGKYPPPPLNGTGHAWHHPLKMLFQVIKNGSPGGQGNMPAWKDQLTDEQIVATIAWFQSHWPEEQYAAWLRQDERLRKGG